MATRLMKMDSPVQVSTHNISRLQSSYPNKIHAYEITYQQMLMSVILESIDVSKTVTIPMDPTHVLAALGTDLELMDSFALVQILSV